MTTGMGRRTLVLAATAVVLATLLLSHRFGRAEPTGDYRPVLPPDALATGCFPLPGGAQLTLAHQVRRDGDVEVGEEVRRVLVGQYDEVDAPEALATIVADFEAVGFVAARSTGDDDAVLQRSGRGGDVVVRVRVEPLPDLTPEMLVRGTFELDLPVVEPASDAAVCSDPKSTKRWPDGDDPEAAAHDRAR